MLFSRGSGSAERQVAMGSTRCATAQPLYLHFHPSPRALEGALSYCSLQEQDKCLISDRRPLVTLYSPFVGIIQELFDRITEWLELKGTIESHPIHLPYNAQRHPQLRQELRTHFLTLRACRDGAPPPLWANCAVPTPPLL